MNVADADSLRRNKAKVFISYSRRDTAFADQLEVGLKANGFDTLIDRAEIYALEDWWKRIEDLIAQADTVVFVLSPDAISSEICRREVNFAASLSKRLAPVVFRRVDDKAVPEALSRLNFIFFDDAEGFNDSLSLLNEALETDIDWIRKHTEFGEQARRWAMAGRPGPRGILLRSPTLEEAERWIATRPQGAPAPIEAAQAFIAESRRAATRRRNLLSASLGSGLVIALVLASLAYWQRGIAVEQRGIAIEQRDKSLLNQSLFLADQARQQNANSDSSSAILLAIEGLPDSEAGVSRPYVPEAEFQLDQAWRALREKMVLAVNEGTVYDAVFSPDGKLIVTASDTVRLWDADTGRQIGTPFVGHENGAYSAAFSPDGKRIVTASYDTTVRLWDVETGKQIGNPLVGHRDAVFGAAFSPDGNRIVSASGDKTVRLWDAKTGAEIGVPLVGHADRVNSAVFSPNGKRILSASMDHTARLWDAATGKQIGMPLTGHTDGLNGALFSPDGRRIVTASDDKTARLWDAETGEQIGEPLIGHTDAVIKATFSPDGKRIVTASRDKTARVWDAETGKQIDAPLTGHDATVSSAAFSANGKQIVTASWDKTARVWATEPGESVGVPVTFHTAFLTSVSFSPDGRRIVTSSMDDTVRLWNSQTGLQIGQPLTGHTQIVNSASFSPDDKQIVTASEDGTARLWNAETGAQIGQPLIGHAGGVLSASFSSSGKRIVTASKDETARVWDAETGKQVGTPLTGHTNSVLTASFSPDGRHIITVSLDKTLRLWNAETGEQIGPPIVVGTTTLTSASFSPDGKRIVTTSLPSFAAALAKFHADTVFERSVRLFDAETGKPSGAILTDLGAYIKGAAFSPDGSHILTTSDNQVAGLWDVQTGKQIGTPVAGAGFVRNAAFSPDGKRIVSGSLSGDLVQVWPLNTNTQDLVSLAKSLVPRCLTREQRAAAFLDPQPPTWCVEQEKWPYQTPDWKDWLKFKHSGANPPLPDTPEWKDWVTARNGK